MSLQRKIEYPIISHPYGEEFSTSLYKMHRYWGRKPPNVVGSYIEAYCPKDCLVLDPFLGSGTTAIEAIRLGRKVIGLDTNPLAIFIAETTLKSVRLVELEEKFGCIINSVIDVISPLYETRCHKCGKTGHISFTVFKGNADSSFTDESPTQISYNCPCSRFSLVKKPDPHDYELILNSDHMAIKDWYPRDLVLPQIRGGKGEAKNIHDLYTDRNLFALARILAEINKIPGGSTKDCMQLAFSSAASQCSRLSGVDKRKNNRTAAMGWILPSFRIMREHVEKNPLESFSLAFRRVLKGKVESNKELISYIRATSIEEVLNGKGTAFIKRASATNLEDILNGNKVDYIFTDPPHGSSQQFGKISAISNAWLRLRFRHEEEIVQDGFSRHSLKQYLSRIDHVFKVLRSVISKKGKLHIYFPGDDSNLIFAVASLISRNGFSFSRIIFQPQRYSFRTAFRGRPGFDYEPAHPGDWILQLEPTSQHKTFLADSKESTESIIVSELKKILTERGEPTSIKYLLLILLPKLPETFLIQGRDILETITRLLDKYMGIIFTKTDNGYITLINKPDKTPSIEKEIEKYTINKFIGRDKTGISRPFLYQAIYSRFSGTMLPDPITIEKVIDKISTRRTENKDPRYFLEEEYVSQRELHSKLILALLRIGAENNYTVFASSKALDRIKGSDLFNDYSLFLSKQRDNLLKSRRLIESDRLVKDANVLWLRDNKVHAHFEVEDTIDIEARVFDRGDQIKKRWPESERVLVVPHKIMKNINALIKQKKSRWYVAPYYSILRELDPLEYEPFRRKKHDPIISVTPTKLKIIRKDDIADSNNKKIAIKLSLECPSDMLKMVLPGHFFMLEINSSSRRKLSGYHVYRSVDSAIRSETFKPEKLEFLRIPISIHRIYYDDFEPSSLKNRSVDFLPAQFWNWIQPSEKKYVDLLIRLVGDGTRSLDALRQGDYIDAVGPLGKPIVFKGDFHNELLVSGGIGIASLYPIAHYLRERGCKVILFAGAKDKRTLMDTECNILPDFSEMGVECHITDEIGSNKFVTDIFLDWLKSPASSQMRTSSRIFSCGPWPMLKEVHRISEIFNLPCTALVDKLMLCGLGACMTCVTKIKCRSKVDPRKEEDNYKLLCACTEGPAFETKDILWD